VLHCVRTLLLTRLGLSQEELAERAGLHWAFVSVVERGLKAASLNRIGQLAKGLEITLPELLQGVMPGQRRAAAKRGRPPGSRKRKA
jgi:transcriptional regulator with XRE-family HTH domain